MLLVPNHKVIVPQTRDIAFQVNEIKASEQDIVYVDLFGDSLMCGRDAELEPPPGGVCSNNDVITGRVTQPPDELIALFLPQYKIVVTTRSVGSSTSGNLLAGTDTVNGPWPDNIEGNIVVINHGFNDARLSVPVNQYKNNLIALRQGLTPGQIMVWCTPAFNYYYDVSAYVTAMKQVAAQFNDIVADLYNLPGWSNLIPDGIHPRQFGYVQMVDQILAPAVNRAVLRHFGNQTHKFYRQAQQQKFILDNEKQITLDFKPMAHAWLEVYHRDNTTYQIVSRGYSDSSGTLSAGIYDYKTGEKLIDAGRSYNLVKIQRETGKITQLQTYDVYGSVLQAEKLAIELNRTNHDYIVIVYTYDEPQRNRTNSLLLQAMYRCGASPEVFNSQLFKYRSSYILVGIPGIGPGAGFEAYNGESDNYSVAYSEIVFELLSNATPYPLDVYPLTARAKNANNQLVQLTNSNRRLLLSAPLVNGTRIVNGKYPTHESQGVLRENYNLVGNKIYFENSLTGVVTVICDTKSAVSSNAHVIDISNIHSYDYFTYRMHNYRWARGNASATLGAAATGPLAPSQVEGASGVNNLGPTNTYVNMRVGDALYAEPVVLSQPSKGYVRLTSDRKKMAYVPFPNTYGLDSFSYTMLTQHGQIGLAASAYVEILPGAPDASYELSTDKTFVNEGDSVVITLVTTGIGNGNLVPYEISGVSSADLGNIYLTGNFSVLNNNSSVTFNPSLDRTTEGNENLVLSLLVPVTPRKRIVVEIGDESRTPAYQLTANSNVVTEGDSVTFTLNTTNVSNGEIIGYTISGITAQDIIQALTGTFTVQSNTATANISVRKDKITEGAEAMIMTLDSVVPVVSKTVSILDTSMTQNFVLQANRANINEGESVQFTLTTINVEDGTLVPYTVTGSVTNADITQGNLQPNTFAVFSGSASVVFTANIDRTTEGSENIIMTLPDLETTGNTLTAQVTINDTSLSPTYAITANRSTVNEGQTVTFTLATTDVLDGTLINYSLVGSAGFNPATDIVTAPASNRVFVVNNNLASESFTLVADRTTEGNETLTAQLNLDPAIQASVIVNDTSMFPSYALSSPDTFVRENSSILINLVTTELDNGTIVPARYRITGQTDQFFNFVVNNNSSLYTISVPSVGLNATLTVETPWPSPSATLVIPIRVVLGCGQGISGTSATIELDFGTGTGVYGVQFNSAGVADALTVEWNGTTVINTGFVSGSNLYTFNKNQSLPRHATATLTPSRPGSIWNLQVICP